EKIKRSLKQKKIGHAGTLDPNATGLLVVAVGHATRFLNYLQLEPKVYVGTIRFGEATNTYDADGEIVETCPPPSDLEAVLDQHLPDFRGEIEQLPPMYSAVKKQGKPLYVFARKGEDVERETRKTEVYEAKVIDINPPEATLRFVVQGGTYVRSIAHDLGHAASNLAHLKSLRRTHIGEFDVEDAIPPKEFEPEDLIPLNEVLDHLPWVNCNEGQAGRVSHGNEIIVRSGDVEGTCVLADRDNRVLALGEREGNLVRPVIVVPEEAKQ
ncbi:MAG: tRNA pseudouridine(55) synthase TruB, partial [Fimbriimonadaceae bacterium]